MTKFISLLSGGLDSPVATYLMIKKGFLPTILSFLISDDAEHSMKKKVLLIIKVLKKFTKNEIKVYLIKHEPNLETFKSSCERKLTCVLCKRMMIRIAKEIGRIEDINLLITGDILGEQASQTLNNLYSYNDLLNEYILLRPLIGCNKLEIIKINEKVGLYDICSQSSASCHYNPQFPETHAKLAEVINAEPAIEFKDLINHSLKSAEVLYL